MEFITIYLKMPVEDSAPGAINTKRWSALLWRIQESLYKSTEQVKKMQTGNI